MRDHPSLGTGKLSQRLAHFGESPECLALLPQVGPAVVVNCQLEVVLATCNGERFLEPQLQSLWHQQRRPDSLLVFDDRSSDGTLKILKQWQQRHPNWIQLLPSAPQRLGPTAAFNLLLNTSTASYVALCDQTVAPLRCGTD